MEKVYPKNVETCVANFSTERSNVHFKKYQNYYKPNIKVAGIGFLKVILVIMNTNELFAIFIF